MANNNNNATSLPQRDYHCKMCALFLDLLDSLEMHLQYHTENLCAPIQNSQNGSEDNNGTKLKNETTFSAPADSTDNMITKPSPEFQQHASPETSTQFLHSAIPQSYHSVPSTYQNNDNNFSPEAQFGNFPHSGVSQNQHPEKFNWNRSQYSQDFYKTALYHPYNMQESALQVSSSSPMYSQPLNQPTPWPSSNQYDNCGNVQLNEHCNSAHAGTSTTPTGSMPFQSYFGTQMPPLPDYSEITSSNVKISSTQESNPTSTTMPSFCGKGANWNSNEARRPKTYNCTACNKWFTSSVNLKRHYNTTLHKNAVRSSGQADPATIPFNHLAVHPYNPKSSDPLGPLVPDPMHISLYINQNFQQNGDDPPVSATTSSTLPIASPATKPLHGSNQLKKAAIHKCYDCDRIFNQACYLTQHNKACHTGPKPYRCDRCGKRFPDDNSYEKHYLKHRQNKPFKCVVCPKSFNHKTDLRRHMYLHSEYKPFSCEHCGKGFIRNDHMMKHFDTHDKKNMRSSS